VLSKNFQQFLWNLVSCCVYYYWPKGSLVEIFLLSVIISHDFSMSPLTSNFTNFFFYFNHLLFNNAHLISFLNLNFSMSYYCVFRLRRDSLSLPFANTRYLSVLQHTSQIGKQVYLNSISSLSICKVVQIWPGQTVTCLHTISPGHIWTTLYFQCDFVLRPSVRFSLQFCYYSCLFSSNITENFKNVITYT
jgi:hypothetical protein